MKMKIRNWITIVIAIALAFGIYKVVTRPGVMEQGHAQIDRLAGDSGAKARAGLEDARVKHEEETARRNKNLTSRGVDLEE